MAHRDILRCRTHLVAIGSGRSHQSHDAAGFIGTRPKGIVLEIAAWKHLDLPPKNPESLQLWLAKRTRDHGEALKRMMAFEFAGSKNESPWI
jgi:hypothetical protein